MDGNLDGRIKLNICYAYKSNIRSTCTTRWEKTCLLNINVKLLLLVYVPN